jgi:hypothetical protein
MYVSFIGDHEGPGQGGADGRVLGLAARRADAEAQHVAIVVHRFDNEWFDLEAAQRRA